MEGHGPPRRDAETRHALKPARDNASTQDPLAAHNPGVIMRTRHSHPTLPLVAALLSAAAALAQDNLPPGDNYRNETPEQRDPRMSWWREAKVGVLYRWGLFSVPAGKRGEKTIGGGPEWMMFNEKIPVAEYRQFAKQFTAAKYDPDAWAALAKDAGARYLVMSAKDLDGFALFDSAATDWDAKAAACARDLIKPMADACQKADLRLGLHYCHSQDWVHPGGGIKEDKSWDPAQSGDFNAFFNKIPIPQIKELMSKYGPISLLWLNENVKLSREQAVEFFQAMIGAQPKIIMNSRLGHYRGDFYSIGGTMPPYRLPHDWEYHITLNDSWGFKAGEKKWKDSARLVRAMAEAACKGANFLMVVGPDGEGAIPPEAADRMRAVGAWLKANGEAIYGTSAGAVSFQAWGGSTQKPRKGGFTLYLHVLKWPSDGTLHAIGLRSAPTSATLLASGEKVEAQMTNDGMAFKVPAAPPDAADSIIKLEVDGELYADKPVPTADEKGQIKLEAPDAMITRSIPGEGIRFEFRDNQLNLSGWDNAADWVSWRFVVREAGNFKVEALIASERESAFRLDVGEESLFPVVPGGGDFGKFKTVELGEIKIAAAGFNDISMRPIGQTWKPINIRRLILTPVK